MIWQYPFFSNFQQAKKNRLAIGGRL